MPKVSVIIPTHNRAEFLRAAIQSVLDQTFQDFEILVVDDASEDDTPRVVGGFRDPRIRYFRHAVNRRGAAARNTGIRNAACDYIAFLDDDDEWLPDKLRLQLELLERSPAKVGLVYSGYIALDRATGEVLDRRRVERRGDLSEDMLRENWIGSPSCVLVRRECFRKSGMFDERLPSFQDHDLWIRISRDYLVDCVGEPLFKFHSHPKRVWTDLDALSRGMEIMVEKHGGSPIFRRHFSYRYLRLAIEHLQAGNRGESVRAFLAAIRLHPHEPRHYFNLCLSLLGPRWFQIVKEKKESFLFRPNAPAAK
jgi:glycosyltransferase involved in cell wall biosynthesis